MPSKPRHQPVDVAGAVGDGRLVAGRHRVASAGVVLEGVVDQPTRRQGLGAARVIAIDEGRARRRCLFHREQGLASAQPTRGLRGIDRAHVQAALGRKGRGQGGALGPRHHHDVVLAWPLITEGHPERDRDQDREGEGPEQGAGLAENSRKRTAERAIKGRRSMTISVLAKGTASEGEENVVQRRGARHEPGRTNAALVQAGNERRQASRGARRLRARIRPCPPARVPNGRRARWPAPRAGAPASVASSTRWWPPIRLMSSLGEPRAMSLPRSTMATRSQRCSASSM